MNKTISLLIICIAFALNAFSQTKGNSDGNDVKIDRMPVFVLGDSNVNEYIGRNLRYPKAALENGIQGRVYVQFIIDEKGKVLSPRYAGNRKLGGGLEEEAVRVVSSMPDSAWLPAIYKGKKIRLVYTLPVLFQLR